MTPAFCERMRDILDALALGQINKDEAVKQLTDLTSDYHEAHAIVRATGEIKCRST